MAIALNLFTFRAFSLYPKRLTTVHKPIHTLPGESTMRSGAVRVMCLCQGLLDTRL